MIIQEKECVHGSPLPIVIPASAKFMQIIQLQITDAARVGLRVRELPSMWGVNAGGNPIYTDLAIGDRIPLPLTTDHDGPAAHNYELYIPWGPGDFGTPEIAQDYSTRVVLAFAERRDGADLWMPHQRWSDVSQEWALPAVAGADMPNNIAGDYDTKNLAVIPCKGFVSGVLDFPVTDSGGRAVMVSVQELHDGNCSHHVIPLAAIPGGEVGGGALPHRSLPFYLTGQAERILIRCWRLVNGVASPLEAGTCRLFAKRTGPGNVEMDGWEYNLGAVALTRYHGAIYRTLSQPGPYRCTSRFNNDATSATNVNVTLVVYANAGMSGMKDQHLQVTSAASAGVVPGGSGSQKITDQVMHCAMMNTAAAGAGANIGRGGLHWVNG